MEWGLRCGNERGTLSLYAWRDCARRFENALSRAACIEALMMADILQKFFERARNVCFCGRGKKRFGRRVALLENFPGGWTQLSEKIRYDSTQDPANNGLYNKGGIQVQVEWVDQGGSRSTFRPPEELFIHYCTKQQVLTHSV